MPYYALIYHVVDGYVEKRTPFRSEHLRLASEAGGRGELLLGGAFGDPVDGALLIWRTNDRKAVEEFVRLDPYVANGLVRSWEVREWTVVVGSLNERGASEGEAGGAPPPTA